MHREPSLHLKLGERQSNWLRRASWQRAQSVERLLWLATLKALKRESSLTLRGAFLIKGKAASFKQTTSTVRHLTRCRESGRARQVTQAFQLARMHLRAAMAEGRLAGLRLSRRSSMHTPTLGTPNHSRLSNSAKVSIVSLTAWGRSRTKLPILHFQLPDSYPRRLFQRQRLASDLALSLASQIRQPMLARRLYLQHQAALWTRKQAGG